MPISRSAGLRGARFHAGRNEAFDSGISGDPFAVDARRRRPDTGTVARCRRPGGSLRKYPGFIAPTRTGYSAHVPDLPGCIAAGQTRGETLDLMQGAIEMHLRAMREDGDPIPEPSQVEILEVA